jgi:hypothetical protein
MGLDPGLNPTRKFITLVGAVWAMLLGEANQ